MLEWNWSRRIIAYMDDGILYGNKWLDEKAISRFKAAMQFVGSPVNESKSRWLKKDGKWLVDSFKFLGVTYIVGTKWLRATSRNGQPMDLPAKDLENRNVDLRGASGQVFLQYLKGHSDITTMMKWKMFDAILARAWCSGEKPELKKEQFELVAHPLSFISYYKEHWFKTGRQGPRTPFTVANASSRAARMQHKLHPEIAQRSWARSKQ